MLTRHIITAIFTVLLLPKLTLSLCRYRNSEGYPPQIFGYWANWGCYRYIRSDLFVDQPLDIISCDIKSEGKRYKVPGIRINGVCREFNYLDSNITAAVQKTLKKSVTLDKWISCCQDAESCCSNVMMKNVDFREDRCPSVWDGWSCFNPTPKGEVYEQICPSYAYSGESPRCHHYSSKECFNNGTWKVQTDYSTCSVTPRLISRTQWHISTLTISIVICVPAVIVLLLYNNFKQQKFILIRNLILAIILRNFFVLLTKGTVIMDELTRGVQETMMQQNAWPCKFMAFGEKLFGNAVFTCMLLEAIFLHQLVTNVFGSRQQGGPKMTWFYVGGAFLTIGTAVAWSVLMAIYHDQNCWMVTEGTNFHWIYDIPRVLMLVANAVLLTHIIFTLWRTLQHREDEQNAVARSAKTLLLCMPLFGVPFFFVIVHPDTESCPLEQAYYFIYYAFEALQGILIVTLNCYTEREVRKKFKLFYKTIRECLCSIFKKPRNSCQSETSSRADTLDTNTDRSNMSPSPRPIRIDNSYENSSGVLETPLTGANLNSPQFLRSNRFLSPTVVHLQGPALNQVITYQVASTANDGSVTQSHWNIKTNSDTFNVYHNVNSNTNLNSKPKLNLDINPKIVDRNQLKNFDALP